MQTAHPAPKHRLRRSVPAVILAALGLSLADRACLAAQGAAPAQYAATVAPFEKTPVIDGKIEPGEWDGAVQTVGFAAAPERLPPRVHPLERRAGVRTRARLEIAPPGSERAEAVRRDGCAVNPPSALRRVPVRSVRDRFVGIRVRTPVARHAVESMTWAAHLGSP